MWLYKWLCEVVVFVVQMFIGTAPAQTSIWTSSIPSIYLCQPCSWCIMIQHPTWCCNSSTLYWRPIVVQQCFQFPACAFIRPIKWTTKVDMPLNKIKLKLKRPNLKYICSINDILLSLFINMLTALSIIK